MNSWLNLRDDWPETLAYNLWKAALWRSWKDFFATPGWEDTLIDEPEEL